MFYCAEEQEARAKQSAANVAAAAACSSTAVAPAYVPREFSAGCSVFGEAVAGESNFGNTCYER